MLGVWHTQWEVDELHSTAFSYRSLTGLLRLIYEKEAKSQKKSRVFVKENNVYRFLPFLLTGFAEAKFVYLVRDPRDMALFWKRSPSLRGCVIRAAKVWKKDQSEYLGILSNLAEQDKIILLRYEDLLRNPEQQLRRLCDFLQIDFDVKMIEFRSDSLTAKNALRTDDWKNLKYPLLRNNFNR